MANQFTKYTGNVTGVAGSLITALDAALVTGQSWVKTAGTNRAAYRPPSGNQLYLCVDDSAVVTAKEARITGCEASPNVSASPITGTNLFPTAAQNAAGNSVACMIARKSFSADATNRAYQIYADARTMYMFVNTADPSGTVGTYLAFMFGEIYSLVTSDAWNTMIVGRTAENVATIATDKLDIATSSLATTVGHYLARAYTGLPVTNGSLNCGVHLDLVKGGSTVLLGTVQYPNGADGGLYVSPIWVHEAAASTIRGRMRGFWQVCHAIAGFNDGDTFNGTGDLAGKSFALIKATGNAGIYCIETSATLETN